jgi:hypothetical protein
MGTAITGLGVSRTLAATVDSRAGDILLGVAVPVLLIIGMLRFSRSYPDHVTHHSQDSTGLIHH